MRKLHCICLLVVAWLLLIARATATDYFWAGPANGSATWDSSFSWTPFGFPGLSLADNAFFNSSSTSLHTIIAQDVIGADRFEVRRGRYRLTHDNEPDWELRLLQSTDRFIVGTSTVGAAEFDVVDGIVTIEHDLQVATSAGTDGTLTSTNTEWIVNGTGGIQVGHSGGTGVFELSGNATLQAPRARIGMGAGGLGTWRILDDVEVNLEGFDVGVSGGSGTVDIEGTLMNEFFSTVGVTGTFGRVNVEDGGDWSSLYIDIGSNGVLFIEGTDVLFGPDRYSTVYGDNVGVASGGSVTIENFGELLVNDFTIHAGADVNLVAGGRLVTTGTGFQVENANDFDWLGGTLEFVGNGIDITTGVSDRKALGANVTIANDRTLDSVVSVKDGGELMVTSNGTVEGIAGYILADGTVTLTGNNARWNVFDTIFSGDTTGLYMSGTNSQLSVLNGADLHTDSAEVRNPAAIVVDGAGSTWTGNEVLLGEFSPVGSTPGTLAIRNGATMTVDDLMVVDEGFAVTMNQGSLTAEDLVVWGNASITPAPGALISGNITVANVTTIDDGTVTLTALSSSLIASGNVTVQGGGTLNAYINGGAGTNVTLSEAGSTWTTPNVVATVLGSTTNGVGRIRSLTLNTGAVANLTAGVSYDPTASDGLTLAGGTLNAPTFNAGNIGVNGRGTINASYSGSGAIIPNGPLTIGNAGSPVGFATTGQIIAFSNPLTLNDADAAELGSLTAIGIGSTPGAIFANNGIALGAGETLSGFGAVNTPNVSFLPLVNNGAINGTSSTQQISMPGYVTGGGSLTNATISGTYSPGNSIASVSTNNLTLAVQSALIMDMRGTTPGNGHDKIVDAGTLTIGGQLQILYVNDFNPSLGDTFDLFDFTTMTGTFYDLNLPALDPGLFWDTSQLYTQGRLNVVQYFLEADFEEDGDVDVNDLVRWQDHYGESGLAHDEGDADADEDADGRDFLIWQRQYTGKLFLTAGTAVPEPSALILLFGTALSAASCRCRII